MISKETHDVLNLRPLIQQRLDEWCKKNRVNFGLTVSAHVIEQDDWTYYTIVPEQKGVRSYEYVSVMAEIERFLSQEKHVEKVLLVPAILGEEDATD